MFGGFFVFPNFPPPSDFIENPNVTADDMWNYDPASGQWTWVGGPSGPNNTGNYGTQGVPSPTNMPTQRAGALTWTDSAGNFWLFGGGNAGSTYYPSQPWPDYADWFAFNDLWEYSPITGEWTWMGGTQSQNAAGVYGTQGVASVNNVPGARSNGASWVDSSGDFWLFGGQGVDSTGTLGSLNDLWKFNQQTGAWTWVSGSNLVNAPGNLGTVGVSAARNIPGARTGVASWRDAAGNFWLFGGEPNAYPSPPYNSVSDVNDMWIYTPSP